MEDLTRKEIEKKLKKLDDIEKSRKRQYKNQNEFVKQNYKRISITVKKEVFQELENDVLKNESINGYINRLIMEDLKRNDKTICPFG